MTQPVHEERYPQLVFIWFKDRPKFARYGELVAPIVEPYGARLDRQFQVVALYAEGLERPDVVNLVSSPTRERFEAFHREPKFLEIVHLRSESIVMAEAHGTVRRRDSGERAGAPAERLYVIELAKLGEGGERAYREHEEASEPVMRRYGYGVELEMRPEGSNGFPFSPDIVKVAYFDAKDGMERMHADPAHERIEKELYPRTTSSSIWLVGGLTDRSPR